MSTPAHSFDITVAVTAHSETVIAGPTMRSAEAAIQAAEAEGFSVERLIGFDRPSDACRRYFTQPAFAGWRVHEFDFGDQGQTRNALTREATGRWIAFLDADDLFSENWLALAGRQLASAESMEEKVIVHPELNWGFDVSPFLLVKTAQDDPLFTPYYFCCSNYYDALSMAPREAYLNVPFSIRRIPDGFAYEDWQWNIETMASGWKHVVARDTIIFKRRREMSQTIETSRRKSLFQDIDCMAVDRVMDLANPST